MALLIIFLPALIYAQQKETERSSESSSFSVGSLSDKLLRSLERKYARLNRQVASANAKAIRQLHSQELKVAARLQSVDSVAAAQLQQASGKQYLDRLSLLNNTVGNSVKSLEGYIPRLDSLQTSLGFLSKNALPVEKLAELQKLSGSLKQLQTQLQHSADIQKLLKEQRNLLQQQLEKLGMTRQLQQLNKQVYYYQQQLHEYKALLSDPDKLAGKLLGLARNSPAFKDFFSRNSFLSSLFPMPGGYGTPQALQGLQTRRGVQQQLSQQLGTGGNPQQYMQQQMQQAQSQLTALKDKINKMGGGSSDLEIPDFKPNTQRTKSFWKRVEYGFNIQSQKTNALLPVTSDIALTLGYKLNDKSVIGVGAGYKLGWGKSISDIHITSQGASLRAYLDIKAKGSIWISGGYEYNYQQGFGSIEQLKDLNAWQKSGLIGLTKKYKVGKKNGNLQLLWDFLSYSQVPKTQPLKFRIGYNF